LFQLIELKRNPQGAIDKRIRATLHPMSKNRRGSLASELEEKLKDAKAFNQKYRKQLLERETELQVSELPVYSRNPFFFTRPLIILHVMY
jgi:gamma-aminobutyric acid type B receptor